MNTIIKQILKFWSRASLFVKIYVLFLFLVGIVIVLGESSENLTDLLSSFMTLPGTHIDREVVIWLVLVILSAMGGGFILSNVITSSLRRLNTAVEQLSQGNLETRISGIDLKRRDELGELSRGFNRMADGMVGLLENERRLLRDMSHELRSPLARMKIALELLKQEITMSSADSTQKFLSHLERDVQKMEEMVWQLLERARLDNIGKMNENSYDLGLYKPENVDLCRLVEEASLEMLQSSGNENKTIITKLPDKAVLWADPYLLRHIVDNLINNAFIYTAPGTEVTVSIKCRAEDITLEVLDQGSGVKPEHLENIFRPFYRTSEARERLSGGFGLGLAIAWQAVHIMHGTIWAENADDEGGGLKVTVILPVTTEKDKMIVAYKDIIPHQKHI